MGTPAVLPDLIDRYRRNRERTMPSMNGNPTCQHYRIDNDTAQCLACGEHMVTKIEEAETVLSAPNAAPCRNPAHLAAIEAGEDFECHHPYVPDVRRQKTVVIGYNVTYRCQRCANDGNVMRYGEPIAWDCGHAHRGQRIPAPSLT